MAKDRYVPLAERWAADEDDPRFLTIEPKGKPLSGTMPLKEQTERQTDDKTSRD